MGKAGLLLVPQLHDPDARCLASLDDMARRAQVPVQFDPATDNSDHICALVVVHGHLVSLLL